MSTVYCENGDCTAEATHRVSVSENKAGDSNRAYCETCYEAFVVGLQHARKYILASFPANKDLVLRTHFVRSVIKQAILLDEENIAEYNEDNEDNEEASFGWEASGLQDS